VEAAAGAMREELLAFLDEGGEGFRPYVVSDPTRPRSDYHGLIDNPAWSTLYLWEKGAPVQEAVDRFPRTFAAVKDLDLAHVGARAPSILFSRLQAGARIPAHHGVMNARLICHLPLIVPPGCGFRVGGETRAWREGELLVFDDTVEHEAWNDSDSDRIILIFDVWRPELSLDERRAVAAMFDAVDAYSR
jgi:aspartyl/asparaginyl beta-hydroxylase (cupin superfamily)